ncbi:MAG: sensor histidine kinase [Emergencia sp.]
MKSIILTALFLLTIFQAYSFAVTVSSGIMRLRGFLVLAMSAVSAAAVCVLSAESGYIGQIRVFMLILYIILSGFASAALHLREKKERDVRITRASIRESADHLPSGLCFARKGGQPYLVNGCMDRLSCILTGESIQNEGRFWKAVTEGNLREGAEHIVLAENPAVLLPDGSVWSFSRCEIDVSGSRVIQITASDTTEIYRLTCRLEEENRALYSMNLRLRQYCRRVDTLTRTRERLETRVRIHNDIGQNLIATQYFLSRSTEEGDIGELTEKWRKTIDILRGESEPERNTEMLKYLVNASAAAGVKLSVSGELPENIEMSELLVTAGAEALTNAVRHAGAEELRIWIKEDAYGYVAEYTNDGRLPKERLSEGSGLSGLRRRVEEYGGRMTVEYCPEFRLTVAVPRERAGI